MKNGAINDFNCLDINNCVSDLRLTKLNTINQFNNNVNVLDFCGFTGNLEDSSNGTDVELPLTFNDFRDPKVLNLENPEKLTEKGEINADLTINLPLISFCNVAYASNDDFFGAFTANAKSEENDAKLSTFLLDTGATDHMISDFSLFESSIPADGNLVIKGFNSAFTAKPTQKGTVIMLVKDGSGNINRIKLNDVLYVPSLFPNLLSKDKLTQSGVEISINADSAKIYFQNSNFLIIEAKRFNRAKWVIFLSENRSKNLNKYNILEMFQDINLEAILRHSYEAKSNLTYSENHSKSALLYHRRFGHVSAPYMRKLPDVAAGVPNALRNVPPDLFKNCEICIKSKSSHVPHTTVRRRAVRVFEIINGDIVGPMSNSREGHIYILNLVDDYSGFSVVFPVKSRSGAEVQNVFKEYCLKSNALIPNTRVTVFRCDRASEFIKGAM